MQIAAKDREELRGLLSELRGADSFESARLARRVLKLADRIASTKEIPGAGTTKREVVAPPSPPAVG